MEIDNILINSLLYQDEGIDLDFKSEQYKFSEHHEKGKFLKDILAFANSRTTNDAFILIGVKEIKGGRSEVVGIEDKDKRDTAQFQNFVTDNVQKPIIFSYEYKSFEDKYIGIIHIPTQNRPFYSTKNIGKVKKEEIYIRRGSCTTVAKPDEIYEMCKIDKCPNIEIFFADKENKNILLDKHSITSIILETPCRDDIPEYENKNSFFLGWNNNYNRQLTEFTKQNHFLSEINFAIKNNGSVVAKDVRIELKIKQHSGLQLINKEGLYLMPKIILTKPIKKEKSIYDLEIEQTSDYWLIETGIEKVQPKRTAWIKNSLYIGATKLVDFDIEATIFSDNLSEVKTKKLSVKIKIEKKKVSFEDIKKLQSKRLLKK